MPSISEKNESIHDKELEDVNSYHHDGNNSSERRLTRSAFTKTLMDREKGMSEQNDGDTSILPGASAAKIRNSVFDIRGLSRLRETFSAIDNSVKEVRMQELKNGNGGINILHPNDVSQACQ